MKRLIQSSVIIVLLLITTLGLTSAFFGDTETSTNNILQAGVLDLVIDNTSYYNGVLSPETTWTAQEPMKLFFDFTDIKPNDVGEDTISIHINDNEAWACMDMKLTKDIDNTCNEPESADDPTCAEGDTPETTGSGELAETVNFIFWVDDGDNVLEDDEDGDNILAQGAAGEVLNSSFALADSQNNIFGDVGDSLDPQTTYYIGKAWCFGTLGLEPLPQDNGEDVDRSPATTTGGITCDGKALDNATQTDILTADISFRAVQHRNNPNFVCNPEPTPPPVISCTEGDIQYASSFSNNNQGTRRNGSAVLAERSVPSAMFGPPQTTGAPSDSGFPTGSFFSLGFTGGNIVVGFSSPFYPNPTGPDLQVFEVTGGNYPDEKVMVEVGPSSAGPWTLVSAAATRDEDLELPIASAQFVKLTEASSLTDFPIPAYNDADGYDVDAVKTFCRALPQQ